MNYQNLHTHTTYCDGKLSAEEMVQAALRNGGGSLGFSEHSYVFFDEEYSMSLADIPLYIAEINALKEKYAGQIEIFLGIEQDIFTPSVPVGLDYVIGSIHHVEHEGGHITVDTSFEGLQQIRDEHFGGDIYAVAESYYSTIAEIAEKTEADIVGHFDLIAKQNNGGRLFDESHPRYIKSALAAMDRILASCKVFELSTGNMYRYKALTPYPSEFLLRELCKRGGEIILSSDSHDANSLYYKFDEMRELARSCGFKHIKRLTKDGFV